MVPVEVCLEMYAEGRAILPFFTGHVSRGLLLHILREVDPGLAYDLHREDVPKPYSVTPLRFKSAGRMEEGYMVDVNFPVKVWFRFLKDELLEKFLKYFYNRQNVLIYDVFFNVASLTIRSEGYGELLDTVKEPIEDFRLYFLTPTYLSTLGTDYHYMFPDHVRIFIGLMRLWNMFSNHKRFSKEEIIEYKQWLLENIGVSQHNIRTCLAIMGKKKVNGFIGWTSYEICDQRSQWNKTTQALAKFAQYSNIGGNRTGGFGVTKQKVRG